MARRAAGNERLPGLLGCTVSAEPRSHLTMPHWVSGELPWDKGQTDCCSNNFSSIQHPSWTPRPPLPQNALSSPPGGLAALSKDAPSPRPSAQQRPSSLLPCTLGGRMRSSYQAHWSLLLLIPWGPRSIHYNRNRKHRDCQSENEERTNPSPHVPLPLFPSPLFSHWKRCFCTDITGLS